MVHRGRFRLIRESPRNQSLLKTAVRRASLPKNAAQHRQPRQHSAGRSRCMRSLLQPGSSCQELHLALFALMC